MFEPSFLRISFNAYCSSTARNYSDIQWAMYHTSNCKSFFCSIPLYTYKYFFENNRGLVFPSMVTYFKYNYKCM